MTTKGNEHQRAPWRDPSRLHEVQQTANATPPAVRPPPEHAEKFWHWVATPKYPNGEPMEWTGGYWWTFTAGIEMPDQAAESGWRWIAPCEPPKEGSFR